MSDPSRDSSRNPSEAVLEQIEARVSKENLLDDPLHISGISESELDEKQEEELEFRLGWWRQARLGLFIHWGPYALPAGEWNGQQIQASYSEHIMLRAQIPIEEYERMAEDFNPTAFDALHWVRLAKKAGLKYIIFTAKHHDGFAMYDSKVSDYSIVRHTAFGRDPLRELAEACHEEGMVLGIYYSHAMDWHDPGSQGNTWDYPGNIGAYDEVDTWIYDLNKRTRFEYYLHHKSLPQVRELMTDYGKVGLMWFDCGGKLTRQQGEQFLATVHGLQPHCLVNSRVWKSPLGDYINTSDNQLEIRDMGPNWENIITLNDSWGYKKSDTNWKSPVSIIRQIADVISKNGNLVINIGPTATGEWDPVSESILLEVGDWLHVNGESIYEAGASPTARPHWGVCTSSGNMLYLHIFDPPADSRLIVPGLLNEIVRVYPLAGGDDLTYERMGDQDICISISLLEADPEGKPIVLAVQCRESIQGNPIRLLMPAQNELGVFESEISGSTLRYDTGKKDRNNLLYWSDEQDFMFWTIRVSRAASFYATLEYGCGEGESGGGGIFTLEAAGIILTSEVEQTGGAYTFLTYDIGEITLPAAGEYRIVLRPERITGAYLMQPRKLILTSSDPV